LRAHKICIALNVRLCIKLWYNNLKESVLFVLGSCSSKLGNLDELVTASYVGLFNIRLEVCKVSSTVVLMDIYEVDCAAWIVRDKVGEVGEAYRSTAISNG